MPHQTIDPIVLTAQAILALQTIVSRRLDPLTPAVVTVGTIHAGTRDNIIPTHVDISGTLRSLNQGTYEWLKDEVARTLSVVRALGGDFQVHFSSNYDVLTNDPVLTEVVRSVAVDLLGPHAVVPAGPVMGGEDFGALTHDAPGCYMRLGGGFPGQPQRNHHDPHFDIDESALPIGTAILAETALRYLR
jgi:amidohydrolase